MIRLSIFTVTALAFYLIGVSAGAPFMANYYKSSIEIVIGGDLTKIPMPGLYLIVLLMNILLALRLYLHAWIIDESADYQSAIRSASSFKKKGEWFLRLFWVAGISWLPSAYKEFPIKTGPFSFHVHYFLFLILLFLAVWDCLMYSMIRSYSNKDKRKLKEDWLYRDMIMAIIILLTSLPINVVPQKETFNWFRILPPLGFSSIVAISLIQIIEWIPDIFRAPKISSLKKE